MKKIFVVLLLFGLAVAFAGCGGGTESVQTEQTPETTPGDTLEFVPEAEAVDLVGSWDWVEGNTVMMPEAVILLADGGYSWLGVDYGEQGFQWSASDGVVSYSLGGISTQWFQYEVIDDNTINIEYFATPGTTYTLRRVR